VTTTETSKDSEPERRRRVQDVVHNGEMEGAFVTDQWRRDADEYIAGKIDATELVAITRRRYGLG
jgi:hypothetical protein